MRRLASLRALAAVLCLVLHTGGSSQLSHHRARGHAFLSASAPAGGRLPPPSTSHSLAETAVSRPGPCSRSSGRHGPSLGQEGRHFGGLQPLQGVGDDWVRQARRQQQKPALTKITAPKKKKETKHDSEIKARLRQRRETEASSSQAEEAPVRRRRRVRAQDDDGTGQSSPSVVRRRVVVTGFEDDPPPPPQEQEQGTATPQPQQDEQQGQAAKEVSTLKEPSIGASKGEGQQGATGGAGVVITEEGQARIGTRLLMDGDILVHEDYGFARFQGLFYSRDGGGSQRVLRLLFDNGPADIMEGRWQLISWHSPANRAIKLSKYTTQGFVNWSKKKAKAVERAQSSALELIALYASRETTRREPCMPDDSVRVAREVEATFGYTATSGQQQAFDDVMHDMVFKSKPMDRVVLGDVGFGKTEVAIRAMHRAVCNDRQVAILAPTTVLAAQHAGRIQERFPWIKVELLRGSMPTKEAARIKAGLKDGTIQVVIGTTALTGKGVVFQRLGLLVVDEEQRLGVGQKEKLKALAKGADVLTLSATPIPRTLQMAMTGIRDLTIIESPPTARLAVKTIIKPWADDIVTNALQREVERGGQAFYVVPRIADIPDHYDKLSALLPELVVKVVHGSMDRNDVEETLVQFAMGKGDVLISTTLIENGLDLPNANTVIVVHAHMLGLASLYQLRGRVGRSARQAYAYLLYPAKEESDANDSLPRGEARQRLAALKEFSKLGSGPALAKADLMIRGAGEILGYEQSGEGESIGHELYHRLLSQAINTVRGAAIEPSARVVMELPTLLGPSPGDVESRPPDDVIPEELVLEAEEATTFDQLAVCAKGWKQIYGKKRLPVSARRYMLALHLQLACRTLSGRHLWEEVEEEEEGNANLPPSLAPPLTVRLETAGLRQVNWDMIVDKLGGRIKHPNLARAVRFQPPSSPSSPSFLLIHLREGLEGLKGLEALVEVLLGMARVVLDRREALNREIGDARTSKAKASTATKDWHRPTGA